MKKTLLLLLFVGIASLGKAQMYYGLTYLGGDSSNGVIFSFNAASNQENVVHNFGKRPDGANPNGDLVYDPVNGLFYGMTYVGGDSGKGTIISFDPTSNKENVVYSFKGAPDGDYPRQNLIYNESDGLLYGMTYCGGAANLNINAGGGTIISFNPGNDSEKVLWSFSGPPGDGASPYGNLAFDQGSSVLYGMTSAGGNGLGGAYFGGAGAIISYNTQTKQESVACNFITKKGTAPNGSLVYDNSNQLFYGMTTFGGANDTLYNGDGAIFSFDPTGTTETQLWSFGSNTDGKQPYSNFVYNPVNGILYGMTTGGGVNHAGTIVSFNPSGNTENVVYNFMNAPDALAPHGALIYDNAHSVFYGMTHSGGANNSSAGGLGTIFSFNPSDNTESVLWSFGGTIDGKEPYGSLTLYPPSSEAGINQLAIGREQLTVYPNPTTGQFMLKLNDNPTNYSVEVYNVVGQQVYQSVLSNSQNIINLGNQPDGIYFVHVKSENSVVVEKVLLEK